MICCVVRKPAGLIKYIFTRVKSEPRDIFKVIYFPVCRSEIRFIARRNIKAAQKLIGDSYVIFEEAPLFECNVYPYKPKRMFYDNIREIISAYKCGELAIICKNIGDERVRDIIKKAGGLFAVTWIFYGGGDREGFYSRDYDCQVFASRDGANIKNADIVIALDALPLIARVRKSAVILNLSDLPLEGGNVINDYPAKVRQVKIPGIPQNILDDAIYYI